MSRIRVSYDREADAVSVWFGAAPHSVTRPLDDDRNVHYGTEGTPIGLELLNVGDGVDLRGVPRAREVAAALRRRGITVSAAGEGAVGSTLARAVADALIAHRARAGLSIRAAARLLGISHPIYVRLERGDHTPSFETLENVAAKLGVRFVVDVAPGDRNDQVALPAGVTVLQDVATAAGGRVVVAAG